MVTKEGEVRPRELSTSRVSKQDRDSYREELLTRGIHLLNKSKAFIHVRELVDSHPDFFDVQYYYSISPEDGTVSYVLSWDFTEIPRGCYDPLQANKQISVGVHLSTGKLIFEQQGPQHNGRKLERGYEVITKQEWESNPALVPQALERAYNNPHRAMSAPMIS